MSNRGWFPDLTQGSGAYNGETRTTTQVAQGVSLFGLASERPVCSLGEPKALGS